MCGDKRVKVIAIAEQVDGCMAGCLGRGGWMDGCLVTDSANGGLEQGLVAGWLAVWIDN